MTASAPTGGLFPRTRWTLILAARDSPEAAQRALSELSRTYWRPLWVYLRKKGLDAEEAQDGVQELILRLIEKDALARLAPERGRLRGYLKATADHWLVNRHEKAAAAKRGGDSPHVPLDLALAERSLAFADSAPSAEAAFDREWAAAVMERALARLKAEFESGERRGPFELVLAFFGGAAAPSYKEAAARHHLTVPALKAFLHRARTRFRELVREEVADTMEGDPDPEIAALLEAL